MENPELSFQPLSSFDSKDNFSNLEKADYTTVLGVLVTIIVSVQLYSYFTGEAKKSPKLHTGLMILGYTVLFPYILRLSPSWYSNSMQIFVTVLIALLDWFSFHEDKSRFSEAELCILGNCRWNARVTGHLACVTDTLAIGLLIIPLVNDTKTKIAIALGLLVYVAIGMKVIENMTKDGSVSDLRGKSEQDKCLQARIMRDSWRGGLNDLITALGIMLAWQTVLNCNSGRCDSGSFPMNQITGLFSDLSKNNTSKKIFMFTLARILILDFGMAIVPTYTNYINTSFQHGLATASNYELPSCFDDPE